jgi:hypothetical protein
MCGREDGRGRVGVNVALALGVGCGEETSRKRGRGEGQCDDTRLRIILCSSGGHGRLTNRNKKLH